MHLYGMCNFVNKPTMINTVLPYRCHLPNEVIICNILPKGQQIKGQQRMEAIHALTSQLTLRSR